MSSRVELPPLPAWLASLPLILAGHGKAKGDQAALAALGAAAAALAADPERRGSRSRICFLLAEMFSRYGARTGDFAAPMPINRLQLAQATDVSLTKVKRILSFLFLSQVLVEDEEGIRVVDWPRLCALIAYDRRWVAIAMPDEDEGPVRIEPVAPLAMVTAAGDQASFV